MVVELLFEKRDVYFGLFWDIKIDGSSLTKHIYLVIMCFVLHFSWSSGESAGYKPMTPYKMWSNKK